MAKTKKHHSKKAEVVEVVDKQKTKLAPILAKNKYLITLSLLLVVGFLGGAFLAIQSNQARKQDLKLSSNPVFEANLDIPKPQAPEINSTSTPDTDNNSGSTDTAIFTLEIKDPNSLSNKN